MKRLDALRAAALASPLYGYGRCLLAGALLYVAINLIFGDALRALGGMSIEVYYAQF